MAWLLYALCTALALATADSCVKLAAGRLPTSLALLLYGLCACSAGLVWVGWERWQGESVTAPLSAMLPAVGAGIAFSAVTVGLYLTFGKGAPISVAAPVIRLGGLLLASLVGLMLLREPFTWRYAAGLALAVGGVYLIVTR